MAKRSRKAKEDSAYDTLVYVIAPWATPLWLTSGEKHDHVQVDASGLLGSDDFPPEWPLTEFSKLEYLKSFRMDRETSEKVYFRALRRDDDLERPMLQGMPVFHNGSPVWWTDLDRGPVEVATLFDLAGLANHPQPKKRRKRQLWLLSLKQWDNAEFPPNWKGGPPYVPHVSLVEERRTR